MPARHAVVGGEDALPDGWQEEDIDEVRIEQGAAALEEDAARVLDGAAVAVLPAMRDGIEGIGNGDDTCREGDTSTLEAARVACAVPALVVREDALLQIGVESGERLQHVSAAARVGRDGAAFGGREALDVMDDVEERLVNLADIVEERDSRDAAFGMSGESRGVGEDEGIFRDASDVDAGVGVIGVDGSQERLEGGGGHAFGGLLAMELAPEEGSSRGGGDAGSGDGGV